jgi:hypothetical protein
VHIGKPDARHGLDPATLVGQDRDLRQAEPLEQGLREGRSEATGKAEEASSDLIQISSEARQRAEREEALHLIRESYRGLEGIRRDVVESVRQKVADGYYDQAEILDELAERLLPIVMR